MGKCPFCKIPCGMSHCPYYSEKSSKLLKVAIVSLIFLFSSCSLKNYIVVYNNQSFICDSQSAVNKYTDCKDNLGNYYEEIVTHSGVVLSVKE
jgi:hypothetical protein